jgi:quercetin dioxygenase-like cupin family protein
MPAIDFDTERTYDSERFAAQEVFRTDRSNVVCGFFDPGQFIPVHAPGNDVVISVRDGTGVVREGDSNHRVGPGDVVVVEADTARGIRADDDGRLEALLVTAPPPSDADHEPVRRGIRQSEFEPTTHS